MMAEEATVKKQPAQASTPEPEVPQASLNKFSNDGSFLKKFKEEMDSRQKNRCEKPLDKPAKQGAFIGKRKALLKTNELREKRRKKIEENEDKTAEGPGGAKTDAWKAYMAEVKNYESRSCTDQEGHKRPLVK